MAVNFCLSKFKPYISCDRVSRDGYEVTNLVSSVPSLLRKGFMSESFIRPPVNITINFPCNVDISSVVVEGCLGSQRSSGIQIFSHAGTFDPNWKSRFESKDVNRNSNSKFDDSVFKPVGKAYSATKHKFMFHNRRFQSRPPFDNVQEGGPCFDPNSAVETDLRHSLIRNLNSASSVTVRVFQVTGGAVPAIQKIEIWGQPAISTPKDLISTILHQLESVAILANQSLGPQKCKSQVAKQSPSDVIHGRILQKDFGAKVEIPVDFIDPITLELMALPTLLPSGHSVDQGTIDRHNAEEAKWGRMPNDPFTGVPFTGSNKPMPNTHLKIRIDGFLLKYGDHVSTNGRTVGRGTDLLNNYSLNICDGKQRNSNYVFGNICRSASSKRCHPDIVDCDRNDKNYEDKSLTKKARVKIAVNENIMQKQSHNSDNIYTAPQMPHCTGTTSSLSASYVYGMSSSSQSHSERLTSSLDQALSATLNSLPSFTCTQGKGTHLVEPSHKKCDLDIQSCTGCKESDVLRLYSLPCTHTICRRCLLSGSTAKICAKCSKSFGSAEVTKLQL